MVAGAVNLWRSGERYGYSHFLLTDLLYALQPLLVHQDIACKHKGWRQRVQSAVLASEDPDIQASAAFQRIQRTEAQAGTSADVLPDAHALLHSWPCQVCSGRVNSTQIHTYICRCCKQDLALMVSCMHSSANCALGQLVLPEC